MKNILLVPSLNVDARQISLYTPYGLLSLQSVAQDVYPDVDVYTPSPALLRQRFQSSRELVEAVVGEIDLSRYDTVGFSTVCNSFHHSLRMAELVKSLYPYVCVHMGGPHITAVASDALEAFPQIDAIFLGEAEESFRSFVARRAHGVNNLEGISGIMTRNQELLAPRAIANLDELPFIDSAPDYLPIVSLAKRYAKRFIFPIEASRGCPFKCRYCATSPFWGRRVRRKSSARLITEMDRMHDAANQSVFSLLGDNFGSPLPQFEEFCEAIKAHKYHWGCSLRMDQLKESHLTNAWNGGCRALFAGIESGSQDTLDRAGRNVDLSSFVNITRLAISMGFEVITSFIVGFPWETIDDIKQTFNLHCHMLQIGAVRSRIGLLCPLPGAEGFDGSQIVFDRCISSVALDDLPADEDLRGLQRDHPSMFIQTGRYETPLLSPTEITAVLDAAFRINYLYARSRGSERMWIG